MRNMYFVGLWTKADLSVESIIEKINSNIDYLSIRIVGLENIYQAKDKKYIFPKFNFIDYNITSDYCLELNLTDHELVIEAINHIKDFPVVAFEMDVLDVRFDDYITIT
jgi:hypothetical protein